MKLLIATTNPNWCSCTARTALYTVTPLVSLYKVGDFLDLCRGPHLPSAARAGAFKLLNVAGAVARGAHEVARGARGVARGAADVESLATSVQADRPQARAASILEGR